MTYQSKADLRQRNQWLQEQRDHYYDKYSEKSDELTDERIEYGKAYDTIRAQADARILGAEFALSSVEIALKHFYGVTASDLVRAYEFEQEQNIKQQRKENLKNVKEAK